MDAFYGLGNANYRLQKYQDALAALKEAARLKPTFAQAHYSLGLVYAGLNNKDGVAHEFAVLKQLDPALADKFYNAIKK